MSMWEFEALGEEAVRLIDKADLPVSEKRKLIIWTYDMISGWDTSFIHFRTTDILVRNACFFSMPIDEHPEYASRKAEIDAFIAEGGTWLYTPDKAEAEAIYSRSGQDQPKQFWYDPRMALWQKAVDAGLLEGLAGEPVPTGNTMALIPILMELAHDIENETRAASLMKMFHGFVGYHSEAINRHAARLQDALALPRLKTLLNTKLPADSDWIEQRFDSRLALEYAEGENLENLKWWCAVFEE